MTDQINSPGALRGARVVLGVSGGIACYKAVEVARLLTKAGASVQVVMTAAATEFVGPLTFSSLTGKPAYQGLFDETDHVLHVDIARAADVVLVAPATANLLSKMAHGAADDLLSAVLLTTRAPIVVAPAMHTEMWEHPATRENLETLRGRGVGVIDPEVGELAGGDEGPGRLAEPFTIVATLAQVVAHGRDLAGVRVIVTAGPTQEPIDPVRYLTNRSSGKMGYAIAREAALRGAVVTLLAGPTGLADPDRVETLHIRTVAELRAALLERVEDTDVIVQAAAPADFRPRTYHDRKIKKSEGEPVIELERNPDIAAELGARKGDLVLVGFAAETDDHLPNARKKLADKNLDLIVLNSVGGLDHSPFGSDFNEVVFLGSDGSEEALPLQLKSQVARAICDRVAGILAVRDRG
ncbi:MAG TPA: bifunctional phosphopantothenoylcysteine decarboxylase/phosphopantothenate--cysteine ligase CoaBC [Actinomycetota bacterium]